MLNIAIDGLGGSGKSSLAKGIAQKLQIQNFGTGSIYRAMACAFQDQGLTDVNAKTINDFVKHLTISVYFENNQQHVVVNGKEYGDQLRAEKISVLAAQIAPFPALREKILALQREFASANDCVMEGRDIGSNILPNADFKFFITASAQTRAMRRYLERKDSPDAPSFETVLEDLQKRDDADIHRKVAPLVPAKDAIILDTTNMTLEQSIQYCVDIITKNK